MKSKGFWIFYFVFIGQLGFFGNGCSKKIPRPIFEKIDLFVKNSCGEAIWKAWRGSMKKWDK
ncbi:hypothetical protein ACFLY6_02630 [Candidatus Dependentiae bacterium]